MVADDTMGTPKRFMFKDEGQRKALEIFEQLDTLIEAEKAKEELARLPEER